MLWYTQESVRNIDIYQEERESPKWKETNAQFTISISEQQGSLNVNGQFQSTAHPFNFTVKQTFRLMNNAQLGWEDGR